MALGLLSLASQTHDCSGAPSHDLYAPQRVEKLHRLLLHKPQQATQRKGLFCMQTLPVGLVHVCINEKRR